MTFLFHVVEKCFVGTVNSLNHILNSLAAEGFPFRVKRFLDLRDMFHQLVGGKMFSKCTIVVPVHRNAVVPDGGSRVDSFIQMAVPLVAVQLILIGFYRFHGFSSFLKFVFIIPFRENMFNRALYPHS